MLESCEWVGRNVRWPSLVKCMRRHSCVDHSSRERQWAEAAYLLFLLSPAAVQPPAGSRHSFSFQSITLRVCVWRRASCPSALDPRLGSVFVIPYEVHSRWGCFIHSGVLLVSTGTFRTYKLIRTRSTDGQRCALACGAWRLLLCPYCVWRFSDSSFTAKLYLISATSDEKTGRKSSWEEMTEWISEYLWISAFKPLTAEMAYQWWMSFTVDKARSININRTHTHS